MIHLNRSQYPALKNFSQMVRKDIMNRNLHKNISPSVKMIGQEYGFCNDEINEIVEECYEQLIKMSSNS